MSEPKSDLTKEASHSEHTQRDAETAIMLGGFIFLVSIPVLIGTLFAAQYHAKIVNLVAALVLAGTGLVIALWGMRTIRRKK